MSEVKNFFTNIKEKYFKKEEPECDYLKPMELGSNVQEIIVPEIDITNLDKNKKNIFIMDDFDGMGSLIKDEIKQVNCINIHEHFNIILDTGTFAGFSLRNLLNTEKDLKIDLAFLDITLGGIVDGEELDGIDIAILLKNRNKNCLIKFVTGHTLNKHNPEIFKFIQKFEETFKVKMDEIEEKEYLINGENKTIPIYKHIINKTGNRRDLLEISVCEYFKLNVPKSKEFQETLNEIK